MISPFHNLSAAAVAYSAPAAVYSAAGQQHHAQSVYDAVAAAARRGAYSAGQQPVPYHPADYGAPLPYAPPPPPASSVYRDESAAGRVRQAPDSPNRSRKPPYAPPPQQPPNPVQYTRVQGGVPGGKTSLHAVIDYDDYDEEDETSDYFDETYRHSGVTPIQGPIFLRNGSVPVVPLYGYQKVSNGSLLQIP